MSNDTPLPHGADISELEQYLPYLFHLVTASLNSRFLERLRPYGVTVQRWRVLMVIMNKGPRNISELIKLTLIPQSALSRLIDQMERDSLVRRRISEIDTRVVQVELTDHGRQIYHTLAPTASRHAHDMIEGLTPAEIDNLFLTLDKILTNLGASVVRTPKGQSNAGSGT